MYTYLTKKKTWQLSHGAVYQGNSALKVELDVMELLVGSLWHLYRSVAVLAGALLCVLSGGSISLLVR